MFRQYHTSPFQGGSNPLRVGTIASGTIFHLSPRLLSLLHVPGAMFPRSCRPGNAYRTTPWIVEAFLNGTQGAAARNPRTGHWEERFISGRSDRALLRSLANGRRVTVAARVLHICEAYGAAPDGRYPDLPDVARFHAGRRQVPGRERIAA